MPSAVVALAPNSGAARCEMVRVNACVHVTQPLLFAPVLHDVHVVRDREHDDQRHEHAGEDVVAEAHQRVEPERPEHADGHREDSDRASFARSGT